MRAIKCPNEKCGFIQLDYGQANCAKCQKPLIFLTVDDVFCDIFGNQNNPFQDFTNQGE